MPRGLIAGLLTFSIAAAACASRSDSTTTNSSNSSDRLISAMVTFNTRGDGKDEDSAVSVQLLRNRSELAADAQTVGTEYDDNSVAAPLAMSIRGPFSKGDTSASAMRLRLTPDGDDTWTFNVGLRLTFGDETQQNYSWSDVRLDEDAPERMLVLQGARQTN